MADKKGFGKSALLSWVAGKKKPGADEKQEMSWKNKATVKKVKKIADKDDVKEKND